IGCSTYAAAVHGRTLSLPRKNTTASTLGRNLYAACPAENAIHAQDPCKGKTQRLPHSDKTLFSRICPCNRRLEILNWFCQKVPVRLRTWAPASPARIDPTRTSYWFDSNRLNQAERPKHWGAPR